MNLTRFAVEHRVIMAVFMLVALVAGVSSFRSLPRAEDPVINIRDAVVVTRWPGAPATKVEELVTDPIEQAVLEIAEVGEVNSISRVGQSVLTITLVDQVDDTDQFWDEVRNKIDAVRGELPAGCGAPFVNSDFGDTFSICLALQQTPPPGQTSIAPQDRYTYRQLELLADTVKDELKTIPAVARVDYHGAQDEVIFLDVDGEEWSKIGLTQSELGQLLDAQNIVAPGGSIDSAQARYSITPSGDFGSVAEINEVVVGRQEGLPVRLGDLRARLDRRYVDPPTQIARFATAERSADRTLILAISMQDGENVVDLGEAVQERLRRLSETGVLPPDVALTLVNEIPRQVDELVKGFLENLLQSILIVLAVAWLLMGWRSALIMAAAVPLVMVASFLVLPVFGVWLEQFSIASLIIALGMLVDNAIVVSDNVARLLREGKTKPEAAAQTYDELALPILTSTLTTVAAFGPMVLIIGNTGEYVRSLPIVVSTALLLSYVIAMMGTPLLCLWLLRPDGAEVSPLSWLRGRLGGPAREGPGLYDRLIRWCMDHKAITLGVAAGGVLASLSLVPRIGSQFFPQGNRDQFFIDVWLPEGSTIAATNSTCAALEDLLRETRTRPLDGGEVDCLVNAASFVGGGAPRLILTQAPEQRYANYAFMVVNTSDARASAPWVAELRERVRSIPGARINVKRHVLGPPLKMPVEFRLIGDDPRLLRAKAEEMRKILVETEGTLNPFHDWYNSGYQLDVEIDSEAAKLAGVSNQAVASTLAGLISGAQLTTYREGDHTIPVKLRIQSAQRRGPADLSGLYVNGNAGKVPLNSVARVVPSWEPAVIARRDNRRCVAVGAEVQGGYLSNTVAAEALPRMRELMKTLPPTYRLEQGGELEESVAGQEKISGAFQISAALILLVLVTQYNSLAKPLVILSTVPLALIGALGGLYLTGWAIGFMPMLGIVSLAGVVINNAIILIDFIESRAREGTALRDAVAEAGRLRMGPIVLTTLTTVGGMLPLALFAGPMWAGMAWAVIGGLVVSTGLTLLVVPTIYVTCAEVLGMGVPSPHAQAPSAPEPNAPEPSTAETKPKPHVEAGAPPTDAPADAPSPSEGLE